MGIEDFIEKAAGALAAEKALEAADPNAGGLEKMAAAAGFMGVGALKDHLEQSSEQQADQAPADDAAADAPQDDDSQSG